MHVDQSPIGRTPRSNPATYTGLFTPIRDLFAGVPAARERGYGAGRFSFNVKGGRCEACQGDGMLKVEMHFLPDVYVPCDVCQGKRYNRETLEILYKGKNIAEVLGLTVEDAHAFFSAVPAIARKLQTLMDVGLGYIRLGQSATTLSGGEAQRVKLALELSKRDTGRTLYILDEPTTGLHFHDIDLLLSLVGSKVRDVSAAGIPVLTPSVDIANARITFENGAVANLSASRLSLKKCREIRVFQDNAYLSLDFMNQKGHLVKKSDLVAYGLKLKVGLAKAGDASSVPVTEIPIEKGEPLALELASFVESVRERKQPKVGAALGKTALEVAIAITEQIRAAGK